MDAARQFQILAKNPEDAAADYLQLLWEYTKNDIGKILGDDGVNKYNLKVVCRLPTHQSGQGDLMIFSLFLSRDVGADFVFIGRDNNSNTLRKSHGYVLDILTD